MPETQMQPGYPYPESTDVAERMNLDIKDAEDGVVRCAMAHYNTIDEVERLIRSLDRVLG